MAVQVTSLINSLQFKAEAEADKETMAHLRIAIGLDTIKSVSANVFELSHIDYLNQYSFVNQLIKSNKLNLTDQFKKFISGAKEFTISGSENDVPANLQGCLFSVGFKRELKPFQLSNVSSLLRRNYGATFSVPGAGKTTEILAIFNYRLSLNPRLKLLVICPKNAFSSWDEQLQNCFDESIAINKEVTDRFGISFEGRMCRLTNGYQNIASLLIQEPNFIIISYQQLSIDKRITNAISTYLMNNEHLVAVDESHRIKRSDGKNSNAVLELSTVSKYRYVMSGTPMPQGTSDLINQVKFLVPAIRVDESDVVERLKGIYVRTTKNELGILPLSSRYVRVAMSDKQRELYDKIKFHEKRKFETSRVQLQLKKLKGSIMRMLQISSNPRIINDPSFVALIREQNLGGLIEEYSPKFLKACELATSLIDAGEKVIIWSGFQRNIDLLEDYLAPFRPVIVDGRTVSSENEDVPDSREANILKFKMDPNCKVFIANPAAASEAISLHMDENGKRVCSQAIYLDRNFNASQYIQSVDRIHRIGITQPAYVHVLVTENSMDERVQQRLDMKISAMSDLLDDKSLKPYTSIDASFDTEFFPLDESNDIQISDADSKYYLDEFFT